MQVGIASSIRRVERISAMPSSIRPWLTSSQPRPHGRENGSNFCAIFSCSKDSEGRLVMLKTVW